MGSRFLYQYETQSTQGYMCEHIYNCPTNSDLQNQYMPVARAQLDNWKIRYAFLSLYRSVLALRAPTGHTALSRSVLPSCRAARVEQGYTGLATLRETTDLFSHLTYVVAQFSHRKYLIDNLILEILCACGWCVVPQVYIELSKMKVTFIAKMYMTWWKSRFVIGCSGITH